MDIIRRRSVRDRFWHAVLERMFGDVPYPTDAPFAHATGCDPHRVLIFGSGTAMGFGLRSHQLALPGQLARALSGCTSRGVDVDLIAERCMTAESAMSALEGRLIAPYDAIVVSLGMTDSLRLLPPKAFRARMRVLLAELSSRTQSGAALVLHGMPPVASIPLIDPRRSRLLVRHIAAIDRVLLELSDEFPKAGYVAMPAFEDLSDRTATPSHYRLWAGELADHLAPLLQEPGIGAGRVFLDEAARQRAVEELRTGLAVSDGRLDRVVELARAVLGVEVATISVTDGDRHRVLAAAGMKPFEMPRSSSLSEYAMGARSGLVVPDTTADARFRHMHAAAIGLRFYAGYPLLSPNGHPVGTLAVLSADPRPAESVDTEMLRDVAMLAQRELWATQAVSV